MLEKELNILLRKISCSPRMESLGLERNYNSNSIFEVNYQLSRKINEQIAEVFSFLKIVNTNGYLIFDNQKIRFDQLSSFTLPLLENIYRKNRRIRIDEETLKLYSSQIENGQGWIELKEIIKVGNNKKETLVFGELTKKPALHITLLGSRISKRVQIIKNEICHFYEGIIYFLCIPDDDFDLTDFYSISKSDIVVANWNHLILLYRLFLNEFPSYNKPQIVLYTGLSIHREFNYKNIKEYGIFDFVIFEFNKDSSDSFEQVVKSLIKPKTHEIKLNPIDYLSYRWGSLNIGAPGTHFKMRMEASGIKTWYLYKQEFPWEIENQKRNIVNYFTYYWKNVLRKRGNTMEIKPIWGNPEFEDENKFCFVLMPFAEPFNTIYLDHIAKAIKSSGLNSKRGDDYFTTNSVMDDIWQAINNAEVVLAELTNKNANVFYELGIAHTLGKKVILISQNDEDVPFDLRHMRYFKYEYTPRGCKKLMENISLVLDEILSAKSL